MRPMRPMSAVERFLERLLERPSARLFGTRVQPVQIHQRVERAMEQGKVLHRSGARVPDRIRVRLRPQDLAALHGASELAADVASGSLDWARRRGFALDARPQVTLVGDDHLRPGDIDVEAWFSGQSAIGDGTDGDPISHTRAFRVPVVRSPRATLEVKEPSGRCRTFVAGNAPVTIGRGSDSTITLADDRVSRHHARLQSRGGLLILTDLDSTNGTRVNGSAVHEVSIGDGDVLEIGDSLVTVVSIDED